MFQNVKTQNTQAENGHDNFNKIERLSIPLFHSCNVKTQNTQAENAHDNCIEIKRPSIPASATRMFQNVCKTDNGS